MTKILLIFFSSNIFSHFLRTFWNAFWSSREQNRSKTKFFVEFFHHDRFIFFVYIDLERNSDWCQIYQKMVITIQIWFGLTKFRKDFSVYIRNQNGYNFWNVITMLDSYYYKNEHDSQINFYLFLYIITNFYIVFHMPSIIRLEYFIIQRMFREHFLFKGNFIKGKDLF